MITDSECVVCSTDTNHCGFVNRVPVFYTDYDGYVCGTCVDAVFPELAETEAQ